MNNDVTLKGGLKLCFTAGAKNFEENSKSENFENSRKKTQKVEITFFKKFSKKNTKSENFENFRKKLKNIEN